MIEPSVFQFCLEIMLEKMNYIFYKCKIALNVLHMFHDYYLLKIHLTVVHSYHFYSSAFL